MEVIPEAHRHFLKTEPDQNLFCLWGSGRLGGNDSLIHRPQHVNENAPFWWQSQRKLQIECCPPQDAWSWTRPWLVPMPVWAAIMEYDWDFAGGEAEYKKAFEVDPSDAAAHWLYAYDIGMIGDREQEALAEINRAHQLDPLSPVYSAWGGVIHLRARQYDEAIVVCKKVANENPTFALVHSYLTQAYWGKRMYPQVIEEWYGQLSGDRKESDFASALEQGFHSRGWKGALTKVIEIRQAQRKTGYTSAYNIAQLHADFGNKDQAFRWLNTAYRSAN
jgi:tetratricopeptide (TPR) repeat protein